MANLACTVFVHETALGENISTAIRPLDSCLAGSVGKRKAKVAAHVKSQTALK